MDAGTWSEVQWISWLVLSGATVLVMLHLMAREVEFAAARLKLRAEVLHLRSQQEARLEALRKSLGVGRDGQVEAVGVELDVERAPLQQAA